MNKMLNKTAKRRKFFGWRSLGAGLATLTLVFAVGVPAQAYTTETVWGELNCSGSTVYYHTVRYTSGSTNIQYQLTKSAGSKYGQSGTYLGVYIIAESSYKGLKYMSLPSFPYATLSDTYWLKDTSFKMYGKMHASDGACYNTFSGKLYF